MHTFQHDGSRSKHRGVNFEVDSFFRLFQINLAHIIAKNEAIRVHLYRLLWKQFINTLNESIDQEKVFSPKLIAFLFAFKIDKQKIPLNFDLSFEHV